MNPTRIIETQCTHSEFMQSLPKACGHKPYEIIDNRVIVHDADKRVEITVDEQPIRNLGSLNLPMEKAEFRFIDFTEAQADDFMTHYRQHALRMGGG